MTISINRFPDGSYCENYLNNICKYYNKLGSYHRLDGPAVIHSNGDCEYWVDNVIHRADGPAIIHVDGTLEYFMHGKLHRVDGPAVIGFDGRLEWYVNGVRHRVDGPAIVHPPDCGCGCDNNDNYGDGSIWYDYWFRGVGVTKEVYYSDEFQCKMLMES